MLDAISSDIEISLTEACANVLDHAGPGDSYDVSVTIGPDSCELRVIDVGHGFDHATVQSESRPHDLDAERGRGLRLMHALVDHIELTSAPEEGTLVHLVKKLAFDDSSPARRLLFQALHQHDHRLVSTDQAPDPSETTKQTPTADVAGTVVDLDQPTSSPQSREPEIATYPRASPRALPPRQHDAEER